jgi:bifunctional enzyme CysN/CysC
VNPEPATSERAGAVREYLKQHEQRELLRFVTVGSVDDGKSTLIGRLLHDTHAVYDDQISAVKRASARRATEIDFSLFTDGLKAEREQGITIDVAYRYFSTERRKFIIADTPGHVEYTRNMATGASTANVVVILIDARLGVLQQSRRHAYIAALLGSRHLAVCVNKMDLVDFSREVFDAIASEFSEFAARLGFQNVTCFPVSATGGDNVVARSERTPWYEGQTLLEYLETVPVASDLNREDLRYPVQHVLRPDLDYRGLSGQVVSGVLKKDDPVLILPSRRRSRVAAIDTFEGELGEAFSPMSVTVRLADEIDVSRGDMLVHPDNVPRVGRRFDAMLVWLSERSLDVQKSYLLKQTTQVVRAEVEQVAYVTDLETLGKRPADALELNEIGRVSIACRRPIFFDAYASNRATGAFILIDSLSNNTVAAGMIVESDEAPNALDEDVSPVRARTLVSPKERAERLGQRAGIVVLAGPGGAGKSALAYALERRLFDLGHLAAVVDPDDDATAEALTDGAAPASSVELARRILDAGLLAILAGGSRLDAARAALGERFAGRVIEVDVQGTSQHEPSERAVDAIVADLAARGWLGSER